jgi:hypothetical protein
MATRNLQSVVIDMDTVILLSQITSTLTPSLIPTLSNRYNSSLILTSKDLSVEWMASILFSCTVIHEKNPFVESHPPIPSLIDICDYLAGQKYPASRLSFCPITYPSSMSYDELSLDKSTGWRDLSHDLAKAAHAADN